MSRLSISTCRTPCCALILIMVNSCLADEPLVWKELPRLPDRLGFAGPFVGTHHGALLVAGGANFPEKMPWDGGIKVWYDSVFVLPHAGGEWKIAGRLPRPLGYGVSLSTSDGVICLGGSDAHRHYAECFRLTWNGDQIQTVQLPSLPVPCANFSGALVGDTVYVAGGLQTPTSTSAMQAFWSLDLSQSPRAWQEQAAWPGPGRMLAVAAVVDDKFYLAGGTSLTAGADGKPVRKYLTDVYRFDLQSGWQRMADMPRSAVAAPTPAPKWGTSGFLILGGDDGTLANFSPPQDHPGFPRSVLAYDVKTNQWSSIGDMPKAHVTTSITRWNGHDIMPSGEIRPGVRTPAVWSLRASGGPSE